MAVSHVVLDSITLLIFLRGEPGADRVARVLEQPCCTTPISLAAVLVALAGMPLRGIVEDLARLNLEIAPIDSSCAVDVARLMQSVANLETAFAVALARQRGLEVMLSERGVAVPSDWKTGLVFVR
jgi:ribonuclease VapC